MFKAEDNQRFMEKVSSEEVKRVLKYLATDKSLGLDGQTSDFFLHFCDEFIEDMMDMVEEARVTGRINGAINSTFYVLIPKKK